MQLIYLITSHVLLKCLSFNTQQLDKNGSPAMRRVIEQEYDTNM